MFFIEFTLLCMEIKIKKINLIFTSNLCAVFFKSVLSNTQYGKILAANMHAGKLLFFVFVLFCFFPNLVSFTLHKQ